MSMKHLDLGIKCDALNGMLSRDLDVQVQQIGIWSRGTAVLGIVRHRGSADRAARVARVRAFASIKNNRQLMRQNESVVAAMKYTPTATLRGKETNIEGRR